MTANVDAFLDIDASQHKASWYRNNLSVLLESLQKLRDLRTAAERDGIPSRYRDIRRLRDSLG